MCIISIIAQVQLTAPPWAVIEVITSVCFRVLELEESLGSMHLLEQNIKQKDGKVSSLNQVIQEREENLAELENRLGPPLS